MQRHLPILYTLLLFAVSSARAQTKQVYFERIGEAEGLPKGGVTDIIQDSWGYIWIGSFEGFFKYDGTRLTPSDQGPGNTSLPTNRVFDIAEDADSNIWIGTYIGLGKLERRTGKIKQYVNVGDKRILPGNLVFTVYADRANNIWLNTDKGMAKYDRAADSFYLLPKEGSLYTHCFFEVHDDLLLGTNKGLYRMDKTTCLYEPALDTAAQLQVGRIVSAYTDHEGNTWLCTTKGLWLYNHKSKGISRALFLPAAYNDKFVNRIVQDRKGNYWFCASGNVVMADRANNRIDVFEKGPGKGRPVLSGSARNLFEDSNGNIWIGTDVGINKINPEVSNFDLYQLVPGAGSDEPRNRVQRVHQLPNGSMFYYTQSQLYYAQKLGDEPGEVKNAPPTFIDYFFTRPDGTLWVGYSEPASGIWKFEPRTTSLEQVHISREIDNSGIYQVQPDIDSAHVYWIATSRGLCRYNTVTGRAEMLDFGSSMSRPYPVIRRFQQSATGKIWMDAVIVLLSYDKRTGKIEEHTGNNKNEEHTAYRVRDLVITKDGKIWIAYETGLSCYDEKTGEFKSYTTRNGLKGGNIVYSILCDKDEKLWLTTFDHIISFDPVTEKFSYYSTPDGVHTTFNRCSAAMLNDGRMVFGGTHGLVVIDPARLKHYDNDPPVVISRISVNNQAYRPDAIPEYQNTVEISYSDKVISFEFNALEFVAKNGNNYAYMMKGFDKDWIYAGTQNKATYTNLSPGDYTFMVKATNYSGKWSNKITGVSVIVAPLFWQQWWFRLFVLGVIAALLYYIWQNNREKNKFRQQKEIAEQSDRYRSRFLSSVSHEIRTPLNAIIGLNRLLLDTRLDPQQYKYVYASAQSSESLLTLINDLLDQAKLESGQFGFFERPFSIAEVVQQVYDTFNHKAEEKKLYLQTDVDENIPAVVLGDSVRLHQVLSNLVSNAIKFTKYGGVTITIKTGTIDKAYAKISFAVTDTGIGIPQEKLESIFESFTQIENEFSHANVGTGLGLSISKQLVEQQGGEIHVSSTPDKGTTFGFTITYKLPDGVTTHTGEETAPIYRLKEINVLLVEDTPFNQLLAIEIIKKAIEGAKITVAENGQEALNLLKYRKDFDIILMDLKMPVMDGYETCKAMRKWDDAYYRKLPVIALTANAVPEQLERCKQAGMNGWVTKPIDTNELMQKMYEALNQNTNDQAE